MRRTWLIILCSLAALSGPLSADDIIDGSQTVSGNLTVNGDLTVKGDLIVNGRIISTGAKREPDPEDIFVRLWNLDQQHHGMSVTLRGSDGRWENEEADLRLDEQGISLDPNVDSAPNPMLVVHNDAKLGGPTYQTVKALFDNYNAHDSAPEDQLGSNPTEDGEINAFLDAVMATDVMSVCLKYVNDQSLHPTGHSYSAGEFKDLLKHQWFAVFTNHFGASKPNCTGFEHVFVGDHDGRKIGGHHSWWKYFLDAQADNADSLGHKYKGPHGERYRWIATFRMRWTPETGVTLKDPDQKGFFVGCSPELMLAYGTLGLLQEKKTNGAHPIISYDGGRYELTIHASTLPGSGDPDERRGDQIRSVFPKLQTVASTGSGLDVSVAEALATPIGERVQVTGVIVAAINGEFGLQLADSIDSAPSLAVKLPITFRPAFNPQLNPSSAGKKIIVHGRRGKYTGVEGLVDVTHVEAAD